MQEFFDSLKGVLYERVTSPLFASFTSAWIIINWKFWSILFLSDSSFSIINRIAEIDQLYHSSNWYYISRFYVYPFGFSAFYIFLYPAISKFVYKFHKQYLEELISIKHDIEKKTLLTQEQSDKLRFEIAKIKKEYSKERQEKDEYISSLEKLRPKSDFLDEMYSTKRKISQEKFSSLLDEIKNSKNSGLLTGLDYASINDNFLKGIKVHHLERKIPGSKFVAIKNFAEYLSTLNFTLEYRETNGQLIKLISISWDYEEEKE